MFRYNAIIVCVLSAVLFGILMGISGCTQEAPLPERKTGTPFPDYEPEDWNVILHELESKVLTEKLRLELSAPRQKWLGFYRLLPCNQDAIEEELGLACNDNPVHPEIHNPVAHIIHEAPLHDEKILDLYAQSEAMEDARDPFWMNRSASDCEKYLQLWKQIYERRSVVLALAAEEYLTPAQKKRSGEIQMMFLTSDYPVFEAEAFQSLGLSGEQMEKLNTFRKKMEPEVKAYLDELSRLTLLSYQLEFRDMKKANVKSQEEFCAIAGLKHYQARNNQIDYRALREMGREINRKMRQGVSEILTDAQRQTMDALITNPPDYVQKCIREIEVFYSTEATDGTDALYTSEIKRD